MQDLASEIAEKLKNGVFPPGGRQPILKYARKNLAE